MELYAFDADHIEVAFNARPNAEDPAIVCHKLRKPTLEELNERESQIKYELVEINSREDEIQSDDEVANARLWDKICVAVKGYRGADDWRELTDSEKSSMRPGHKVIATRIMYGGWCEIEGDDNGVGLGADTWTVKQSIGIKADAPDFVVRHVLREPTEAERVKFKRTSSSTSHVKGAKKQQMRVRTYLRAYVELYDALIQSVQGATIGGDATASLELFRAAIDPIWKRQVVLCLTSALEAQISD